MQNRLLVWSVQGNYWYRHEGDVPDGAVDLYFETILDTEEFCKQEGIEMPSKEDIEWLEPHVK